MISETAVAVSGVTGFIGAEVAATLLQRGYTVHGTVRHDSTANLAHLTSLSVPGNLRVFHADLNVPASFDDALSGCTYAVHVASPYAMEVQDPQMELVDPAVKGTLSFLRSCQKARVKKVVLTSSLAAIADGGANGEVVDESVWNDRSTVSTLPYYYSKTAAERAAWTFVEEEARDMKLVVINPGMVLGRSRVNRLNESASMLVSTAQGKMGGIVDLQFPVVDVRDVAEAHVRAMESEDAQGRYICCADRHLSHRTIVDLALEQKLQPTVTDMTSTAFSATIRLMSYVTPGGNAGAFVRNNLGNPIIPTNAKIKRELAMSFRDTDETVKEAFRDLIERGHLKQRGSWRLLPRIF